MLARTDGQSGDYILPPFWSINNYGSNNLTSIMKYKHRSHRWKGTAGSECLILFIFQCECRRRYMQEHFYPIQFPCLFPIGQFDSLIACNYSDSLEIPIDFFQLYAFKILWFNLTDFEVSFSHLIKFCQNLFI